MLDFETSNTNRGLEIKLVDNYFFFGNYVTSEGAVFHNVLYFTAAAELHITRYTK